MNDLTFDVVIVGYGPVGAIAANYLGMYGIKTAVFEQELDVYHLPRAIGFNHEIMRIFQQLGLHHQIDQVATPIDGVEFLNQSHKVLFEIELSKTCLTYNFAPNYVFYQPDLETKLREGVKRFDCVKINLAHAVESVTQDPQGVTVTVKNLNSDREIWAASNRTYQVQAKYVLGCDGGRSITRQQAGIELHDFGFHQRQLVVDTLLTAEVDLPSKVQQLCDTRRPGVFVHSTNNHRRWEFVLAPDETKEAMERPEKVRELLSTYWINPDKLKIIRAVVYHFHSLIALQWRSDRIFIVGDAAHQMPPILGQGMCSGIRDAQNLCWKLDLVLKGLAPDKLLDTYQTERLPHVQEIVKLATRAFKIFKTRNPFLAWVRDIVLRILRRNNRRFQNVGSDMPPLKHGILANSLEDKQSVAGQMFIQPQVLNKTGQLVLLDHILGNSFAILGLDTDWLKVITAESEAFLSNLPLKLICVVPQISVSDRSTKFPDRVELIEDTSQQISDWLAKQQTEIVIIRPDRYVFGTCDRQELNAIVQQLQSCLIGDAPLSNKKQLATNNYQFTTTN
ncbi:MAG: bifunctional 3-(3-hydroxy-phenyl)propionate/3-hydroxycinnamic acid hydroxylase [Pleurocapsa sp.]